MQETYLSNDDLNYIIQPITKAEGGESEMPSNIRETVSLVFLEIFRREFSDTPPPQISDDLILLDSGLDSLGFAILVVELEEKLGFDPFTISDEPFYPTTFGEFVTFYEKNKP